MTPVLLLPAALTALAALIVPLVVHLARRTEQRPTDFAALRWLRERPRPRHRPRLDEWPLLLVRLLLLALLALWLARPAVFGAADTAPVVAVAPGVERVPAAVEGSRSVWLAPGFPDLATARPAAGAVASLVRQLDAELPPGTPLRVIVPPVLQEVDAERPRLSRAVTWQVVPGAMPAVSAPRPATTAAFAVRGESRYVAAAAAALGMRDVGSATRPILPATRALAWIAPGPLPPAVRAILDRGGTVLVGAATQVEGERTAVQRDALGATMVERVATPNGRLLRFTRALTPAETPELLDSGFPRRLAALFTGVTPPKRVAARDYTPGTGARAYPLPATDLRPWLAVVIAALFLLERLLASRRRGVAP